MEWVVRVELEDVLVTEVAVVDDEAVVEVADVALVVMVVVVAVEVMAVEETAPAEEWVVVEAGSAVPIPCPASSNGRGGRGLICPYMYQVNRGNKEQ